MHTLIYVILVWFLLLIVMIAKSCKPSKKVIDKYGQPYAHFSTAKCWNGLGLRGLLAQAIDMDFYSNFVVINGFNEEIVLTKESKNIRLYRGFINPVFEVQLLNGIAQFYVTYRQRNLIKDFFDIY